MDDDGGGGGGMKFSKIQEGDRQDKQNSEARTRTNTHTHTHTHMHTYIDRRNEGRIVFTRATTTVHFK